MSEHKKRTKEGSWRPRQMLKMVRRPGANYPTRGDAAAARSVRLKDSS